MKKLSILFCILLLNFNIFSQEKNSPFKLDLQKDLILSGSALTINGVDLLCDNILKLNRTEYTGQSFYKEDVNPFDRLIMNPYSPTLHTCGNIFVATSLITPCILLAQPQDEWLTIGVMYAETLLFANGIKELGKFAVNRPRPYMYFDGYPQDKIDDGDWEKSWPSGHTTLAFASASFLSYTFCKYYPDSKWKYVVVGTSYSLALTTGILRISSGNHFTTDVLTGALIGTACGLFVPWFHTIEFNSNTTLGLTPAGFYVAINF